MKSKEYWNRRFLIDKAGNINSGEKFLKSKIEQYYKQAHKEIQETIEKFYKKFADKNNITLAEAKRLIKNSDFKKTDFEGFIKEQAARNKELKEKKNSLPKEILESIQEQNAEYEKLLSSFSKKGQITRLELLQVEIQKVLLDLYDTQQINIYEYLSEQYTDAYYKSIFNTQQFMGFGKDFAAINKDAVDRAILNSYGRSNYSETIWGHRQSLNEDLRSNITSGLIRGEALEKMASRISKRLEVSKSNAYRLVRTETAYIYEQATKKAYEECDIEKYKYLATLDRKTSKTCKVLDGKVFNVKNALPGKNYPPMHPNCRSTTVCSFDNDVVTTKLAKDSSGKYYEVPSDMTYNKWYKGLSENEKGRMTMLDKMDRNKGSDKKQLSRYKEVLGKEIPSLSKYQNMKYNNTDEWKKLQLDYKDGKQRLKIRSEDTNKTVHLGKQGKHIQGHNNYVEGRSYLTIEENKIQELVNKYAGTGEIIRNKDGMFNHRERITVDRDIGVYIDNLDNTITSTNTFLIHYAKDGVHIVPGRRRGNDKK